MKSQTMHRIHLKGPWQYEWLGESDEGKTSTVKPAALSFDRVGRIKMPCDWQSTFGEVAGRVRLRRRFHRPTNLEPHERVFVVFGGLRGTAHIGVNEHALGTLGHTHKPVGFDLTDFLQPANELVVELDYDPKRDGRPGGLYEPVAIEIHSLGESTKKQGERPV